MCRFTRRGTKSQVGGWGLVELRGWGVVQAQGRGLGTRGWGLVATVGARFAETLEIALGAGVGTLEAGLDLRDLRLETDGLRVQWIEGSEIRAAIALQACELPISDSHGFDLDLFGAVEVIPGVFQVGAELSKHFVFCGAQVEVAGAQSVANGVVTDGFPPRRRHRTGRFFGVTPVSVDLLLSSHDFLTNKANFGNCSGPDPRGRGYGWCEIGGASLSSRFEDSAAGWSDLYAGPVFGG